MRGCSIREPSLAFRRKHKRSGTWPLANSYAPAHPPNAPQARQGAVRPSRLHFELKMDGFRTIAYVGVRAAHVAVVLAKP